MSGKLYDRKSNYLKFIAKPVNLSNFCSPIGEHQLPSHTSTTLLFLSYAVKLASPSKTIVEELPAIGHEPRLLQCSTMPKIRWISFSSKSIWGTSNSPQRKVMWPLI